MKHVKFYRIQWKPTKTHRREHFKTIQKHTGTRQNTLNHYKNQAQTHHNFQIITKNNQEAPHGRQPHTKTMNEAHQILQNPMETYQNTPPGTPQNTLKTHRNTLNHFKSLHKPTIHTSYENQAEEPHGRRPPTQTINEARHMLQNPMSGTRTRLNITKKHTTQLTTLSSATKTKLKHFSAHQIALNS